MLVRRPARSLAVTLDASGLDSSFRFSFVSSRKFVWIFFAALLFLLDWAPFDFVIMPWSSSSISSSILRLTLFFRTSPNNPSGSDALSTSKSSSSSSLEVLNDEAACLFPCRPFLAPPELFTAPVERVTLLPLPRFKGSGTGRPCSTLLARSFARCWIIAPPVIVPPSCAPTSSQGSLTAFWLHIFCNIKSIWISISSKIH